MAGWRWLKQSQGNFIRWKIFKALNWITRIGSPLFLRTAKYLSATILIPLENALRSCWELRRERHKSSSERHEHSLSSSRTKRTLADLGLGNERISAPTSSSADLLSGHKRRLRNPNSARLEHQGRQPCRIRNRV